MFKKIGRKLLGKLSSKDEVGKDKVGKDKVGKVGEENPQVAEVEKGSLESAD